MKIGIAVSKLRVAIHGENVEVADREKYEEAAQGCKGNTMQVDASVLPHGIIDNLLADELSEAQRRVLAMFRLGVERETDKVFELVVGNPREFANAIAALTKGNEPNAEVQINERWYPIVLTSRLDNYGDGTYCSLSSTYKIVDASQQLSYYISDNTFRDEEDNEITYTVAEVLEKCHLRPLQTDLRAHFESLRLAEKMQGTSDTVAITSSVVMIENRSWWRGVDYVELGTPQQPAFAVIEGEMEASERNDHYGRRGQTWSLPFVRVFALEKKRYCYADVRDVQKREWNEKALDALVLPDRLDKILRKVFDVPTDQLFGDVVSGKAGGMIVLATGGPGVGKTMTAEVFAEHTKRPLYVLEMAELGTNLKDVEDNLRRVFRRATRWNAVLLFDEADVFMAKRDDNLERSAIVGVFLRLMDYYKGMLFLTSNRADVIDPAFKSRITLALEYPNLERERRSVVWVNMLRAAGVELVGDINGVPDIELNGRQIRNMVRLIRVLHGNKVTPTQITEVCQFAAK